MILDISMLLGLRGGSADAAPPLRPPATAPVTPRGEAGEAPFNTFGIKEYNLIYII